jgi:hypothetical protein
LSEPLTRDEMLKAINTEHRLTELETAIKELKELPTIVAKLQTDQKWQNIFSSIMLTLNTAMLLSLMGLLIAHLFK